MLPRGNMARSWYTIVTRQDFVCRSEYLRYAWLIAIRVPALRGGFGK